MKPVVVVGGGITGLSACWELQRQGVPYLLLEASERPGGKISTEIREGFVIEGGADSFLTTKPAALELCREIGLAERLIPTNPRQKNVYVLRHGRLQLFPRGMRLIVPTDPQGLSESGLLSEEGKDRMLEEAKIPPRQEKGDESLASFVRRRFGEEALQVFGESLLAGIYNGNPENLSMEATFPKYLLMEQKYGSLIKGFQQTIPPTAPENGPSSMFVSLPGGVIELVEGLRAALTGPILTGQPVKTLDRAGKVYLEGQIIETAGVILALPARAALSLTRESFPELTPGLENIKTLSSATISFGYKTGDFPNPLDGYGFIVAGGEPSHLIAGTWNSTKLPGRAPEGFELIRVFLGGFRHQADLDLSDPQMVSLARRELKAIMGIEAEPHFSRVFRWQDANTQYEVGHLDRIKQLKAKCPPLLALAGSAFEGVGIPDCIRQGREAAQEVGWLLKPTNYHFNF